MKLSITRRFMVLLVLGVMGIAGAMLVVPRGDSNGVPLAAPAKAQVSPSAQVGFLDPARAAYLIVELGATDPRRGEFTALIPGVGALWPDAPGAVATNADGSFTLSWSGPGRVDADAAMDPVFGRTFRLSGAVVPASFTLSVQITSDMVAANGIVSFGAATYTLDAPRPPHNADVVVAAVLTAFQQNDAPAIYQLLNRNFQAATTSLEFATLLSGVFGSGSSLASVAPISQLRYIGEPGPGYHTAEQWVRLTVSTGGVPLLQVARLSLVLDGGVWRLLSLDPPTSATVVSPANMRGWGFLQETATASGSLVAGPATPPFGAGSAKFQLATTGGGELLGTQTFAGTRLDAVQALNYSTYVPSTSPGTVQAPSLQFDMDYNLGDTNTAWQGRLVFEPYFTNTVTKGTWQTWDPLAGKWWATGSPGNTKCPQTTPCTWAKVLQEFPNAGIRVSVGGLAFKAGSGWPANFEGYVDGFVIVTGEVVQAFDFEAAP